MNCPHCEHPSSRVLESRVADAGDALRRRRECQRCETRFTTYERMERAALQVAKHDGTTEPFDREKLLRGLVRACSKRDVPVERLEVVAIEIENGVRDGRQRTVTSDEVGELALERLRDLDDVAWVRFASVLHAFEDVDEFQVALQRLLEHRAAHA